MKAERWSIAACCLIAVLVFAGGDGFGDEIGSRSLSVARIPNVTFDGGIGEWEGIPPTFVLRKYQAGSRDGMVWVGQTGKGLVIAGKVFGDKPRWPELPDRMAAGDHIEVWLADANEPELPPIGWGNQFGFETLTSEEGCARTEFGSTREQDLKECRSWFSAQRTYRKTFRKLFVRQWQIAPDMAVETYSVPAFRSFDEKLREKIRLLEPSGTPAVKIREAAGGDHAYTFELLFGWNAFPPLKPLRLSDIRVMVDVFNPGTGRRKYGGFSSTASQRKYGRPDTFDRLGLEPVDYHLTPCRYEVPEPGAAVVALPPQTRYLRASESGSLYFMPAEDRDLRTLLLLDNETHGYQYNPGPESASPVVHAVRYFTAQTGAAETVCGPMLSYVHDGKISRSNYSIDAREYFETRKTPDGSILVKEGPRVFYSYYGSGQCGACPRVLLNIYSIDAGTGKISHAFHYEGVTQSESNDIDIHVSESWDAVTVFEEHRSYDTERKAENSRWTATEYCFNRTAASFGECGKKDPSPPPPHRVLIIEGQQTPEEHPAAALWAGRALRRGTIPAKTLALPSESS